MKRKIIVTVTVLVLAAVAILYSLYWQRSEIVLTGIVTTDSVNVSSEIQGRLKELTVKEGDTVTNGELVARIQPQEWKANLDFYSSSEARSTAQVAQAKAELKFQTAQSSNQVRQSEATLAAAEAQTVQANADLEDAKLTYNRLKDLLQRGVESKQNYDRARTAYDAAQARAKAVEKQAQAARAAVALAESSREQVIASRAAVDASIHQASAATAQAEGAKVRFDYTEIRAPISGIVDVRAALPGEVVNPGQSIVTLINPDDLWVRADVEETYIDRVHLGDKMTVRLPSGSEREGTVFYRGVDADYATQRDVSRSKRNIKTFEIRLRCDNDDRNLAVGMTAYVILPLGGS